MRKTNLKVVRLEPPWAAESVDPPAIGKHRKSRRLLAFGVALYVVLISAVLIFTLVEVRKLNALTSRLESSTAKAPHPRPLPQGERDEIYDPSLEGRGMGRVNKIAEPEFAVEGIISDGKNPLAIIGGGFYRAGDSVQGYKVAGITDDRIVLEKGGRTFDVGVRGRQ